jgi:hypothetical protein
MASSLPQAVKVVIEDELAGMGGRADMLVERTNSMQHLVQDIHDVVCAGSRRRREVVGTPHVPVRCRVPYWRVASPSRRSKSRVTAEAA